MELRLRYFASVRDLIGVAEEDRNLADVRTVGDVMKGLRAYYPALDAAVGAGKRVRVAVNQAFARDETPVEAGDEVALFPPVTGG